LANTLLTENDKKYDKSIAQIILWWLIQREVVVIPKSVNPEELLRISLILILNLPIVTLSTWGCLKSHPLFLKNLLCKIISSLS